MKATPTLEGKPLCQGYVNSYEGSDKEGKIHGDTRPVLFDCWVVISGTLGAKSLRRCTHVCSQLDQNERHDPKQSIIGDPSRIVTSAGIYDALQIFSRTFLPVLGGVVP